MFDSQTDSSSNDLSRFIQNKVGNACHKILALVTDNHHLNLAWLRDCTIHNYLAR